jgi:hypothetical protein
MCFLWGTDIAIELSWALNKKNRTIDNVENCDSNINIIFLSTPGFLDIVNQKVMSISKFCYQWYIRGSFKPSRFNDAG